MSLCTMRAAPWCAPRPPAVNALIGDLAFLFEHDLAGLHVVAPLDVGAFHLVEDALDVLQLLALGLELHLHVVPEEPAALLVRRIALAVEAKDGGTGLGRRRRPSARDDGAARHLHAEH